MFSYFALFIFFSLSLSHFFFLFFLSLFLFSSSPQRFHLKRYAQYLLNGFELLNK